MREPVDCPGCDGYGWVFTDHETNTVRPCEQCNMSAWMMWRHGHWDARHNRSICEVCMSGNPKPRRRKPKAQQLEVRDFSEAETF